MAEGHIVEAGEGLHTHPIHIAHGEFALRFAALTAGGEGVGHEHGALAGAAVALAMDAGQGQARHLLVAQAQRWLIALLQRRAIHARLQIGERVDRHGVTAAARLHQHRLMGAGHVAADRDPEAGQQRVVHRYAHV